MFQPLFYDICDWYNVHAPLSTERLHTGMLLTNCTLHKFYANNDWTILHRLGFINTPLSTDDSKPPTQSCKWYAHSVVIIFTWCKHLWSIISPLFSKYTFPLWNFPNVYTAITYTVFMVIIASALQESFFLCVCQILSSLLKIRSSSNKTIHSMPATASYFTMQQKPASWRKEIK
jgi:hypothetical protein